MDVPALLGDVVGDEPLGVLDAGVRTPREQRIDHLLLAAVPALADGDVKRGIAVRRLAVRVRPGLHRQRSGPPVVGTVPDEQQQRGQAVAIDRFRVRPRVEQRADRRIRVPAVGFDGGMERGVAPAVGLVRVRAPAGAGPDPPGVESRTMPRPPPEAPLLGIEGLAGRRGDRLLFSGLSAVARPGEALRLRGPNGCGKTTALRIVCGLLPPEAGRVRWRGRVVSEPSEPSGPSDPSEPPGDPGWRRELAFVGHREALKETLTPLENLAFARALRGGRARRRPEEALERVGLARERDALTRDLSAGQRRRTALARLLLDDSALWVLDEPAAALDREGAALVEAMCSEHAAAGGALVFTSHQPLRLSPGPVRELRIGRA